MWRNLATWDPSADIDLPGPAEWWSDDYDYQGHGFEVPQSDNGHQAAFALLLQTEWSAQYNLVFPSDVELRLMVDSPEARFIQEILSKLG